MWRVANVYNKGNVYKLRNRSRQKRYSSVRRYVKANFCPKGCCNCTTQETRKTKNERPNTKHETRNTIQNFRSLAKALGKRAEDRAAAQCKLCQPLRQRKGLTRVISRVTPRSYGRSQKAEVASVTLQDRLRRVDSGDATTYIIERAHRFSEGDTSVMLLSWKAQRCRASEGVVAQQVDDSFTPEVRTPAYEPSHCIRVRRRHGLYHRIHERSCFKYGKRFCRVATITIQALGHFLHGIICQSKTAFFD